MALHNIDLNLDHSEIFDHEWLCAICFKAVSQHGPPILNLDNCSCSETGKPVNDPEKTVPSNGLDLNLNGLFIDTHSPISYPASDDGSIKTPDGPDTTDPSSHHRRASYDEAENQMSYPLRHYLKTSRVHERSLQGSLENSTNGWLMQDTYDIGPTESANATWGYGSGSGSATMSSERSLGSSGLRSWNVDSIVGTGAWAEGDNTFFAAWSREIDDRAFEDNDDEADI